MISARELSEVRDKVHRWLDDLGATRRGWKHSVTNGATFESVCDEVLPANCAKEEWSAAAAIVLLDWTTGSSLLPSQGVSPDHPALVVIEGVAQTLRARLPPEKRARTHDGAVRDLPRHLRANEMLVAALLGWRGESAAFDRVGPYYAQWSRAAREVVRTISFVVLESQLQWLRATDDRLKLLETNLNFDQVVDVACDNFIGNVCDCALRVRNRANRTVRGEHCGQKHLLNSWDPALARPSRQKGSDPEDVLDDTALLWNFAAQAFSGRSSFYASHILASFALDPAGHALPLGQDGLPERTMRGAATLTETPFGRQQRLFRLWRKSAADFCRGMLFHEINRHQETLGFQPAAHFLCRTCRQWRTTACQRPDCGFDTNLQHPAEPLLPDRNVVALPIFICLEGTSLGVAHFNKRHARWCHCRRLERVDNKKQEGAQARVLVSFRKGAGAASAEGASGERKKHATPTLRPPSQQECPFCKEPSGAPRPIWVPLDCLWFDAEPPGFDRDSFVSGLPKEIAADVETTQNIVNDLQTLLNHWDDVEAELRASNNLPQNMKKVFKKFLSDPIRYWWVALPVGLEKGPSVVFDLIGAKSEDQRDEWLAEWRQLGLPYMKLAFKKLNLSFRTMTL